MIIRFLFKNVFMLGLTLVVLQGWSFSSGAEPLKKGATDGKEEKKVTSQVEKSGQKDAGPKEGRIVLLGASYVRAWNIEEIAGLKVVNKGVNGNQSFEMLSRFPDDVLGSTPCLRAVCTKLGRMLCREMGDVGAQCSENGMGSKSVNQEWDRKEHWLEMHEKKKNNNQINQISRSGSLTLTG